MDRVSDFFDQWLRSQERFVQNWMETSKKVQESLADFGVPLETVRETVSAATDTTSKLFSSSNVYVKLSELWLPLMQALQEKAVTMESYKDLLDPQKYKEVMDTIFGLSSPEAMTAFYDQAVKMLQTLGTSTAGFTGPWTDAFQRSMKTMPQLVEGRPESLMHIFHNMFNAFDSTFGKVFHVPAVGKDREKITLLLRTFDDLAVNMAKNIEYHHLIYATGLTAMEKVIEALAWKIKGGEEISSFDQFFDLWIDLTEKTYLDLFQKEEFSRIQGELLESTLTVRKHFFKLMELYLYDFPIALRSEMDDLYKTIYDLKKKVKGLEKQINGSGSVARKEATA